MYWTKFRIRMWSIFAGWLIAALVCVALDHIRASRIFLPTFLLSSAIIIGVATKKHRPRNYRFNLVRPGVIRSQHGFEVQVSNSRLAYVEGHHVVSWQPTSTDGIVGRFSLTEQGIAGWDPPFGTEAMDSRKKREIAKAVRSALIYLQLIDAGKIRPKAIT